MSLRFCSRCLMAALVLFVGKVNAVGAERLPPMEEPRARQALVVFDDAPIFIEIDIHVRVLGNSLPVLEAWQDAAMAEFRELDTNRNGMLSEGELNKMWQAPGAPNRNGSSGLLSFAQRLEGLFNPKKRANKLR